MNIKQNEKVQDNFQKEWHQHNKSIRTNQIVNIFEGSMMELLANSTQGSGLIRNRKHMMSHSIEGRNNTSRDQDFFDPNHREKIYIKRHLLKTRGVTALTKSINRDTSDAMKMIRDIQGQETNRRNNKLENVDLSKLIQQTNKDFRVAMYDL